MDAELERTWERLGIDGTTLTMAADGTLRAEPAGDESRSTEAAASDAILPLADSEVVLGPLLGEGGMGQVWLGEQRSLRRQVAVKGLRDAVDGALGRAALLREARVTGGLEHPNIVPVHVLVQTEDGAPRMVMKRVEGRSWTEVLADLRAEGEPLPEAHLEGHLRLLMQVCHAVHYAHARGVLHRDLKPDNVMVGDFGEVYVVDWGIAVALDDAEDLGDLPRARDVRGIVGTLPYMAPEMVAGDGAGLGVPTDVYLLGAILHELLTGHPRHRGDAVPQLVHAAWVSAPPAMGAAPEELVDLVTRATAKDPAARPSSADAFRSELEAFLTHREANLLAREGHERLAEAQAAEAQAAGNQAAERQAAEDSDDATDPTRALQEARFAFLQALRIWPESPRARPGLDAVLDTWMTRAIDARDAGMARALLADMQGAQRERWAPEVEALSREVGDRDRKLAALEAAAEQADLGVAARNRRGFGIAFAVLFTAVNAVLDWIERSDALGHMAYVFWTGLVALLLAPPVYLLRRSLFPNEASRRLGLTLVLMLGGQVATFGALMVLNVPIRSTLAVTLFSLASMVAVKSAMVDRRTLWIAPLTLVLGILALMVPTTAFYAVAIGYATFFGVGALLPYDDTPDS